MSGGIAWVYDPDGALPHNCNPEMVELDPLEAEDEDQIQALLRKHVHLTGSQVAKFLLMNWSEEAGRFVKVFPSEYKKVLQKAQYATVR